MTPTRSDTLLSLRIAFPWLLAIVAGFLNTDRVHGQFDLVFSYASSADFTAEEIAILDEAIGRAEAMWEGILAGYRPGISIPSVAVEVRSVDYGLAAANFTYSTWQQGFRLATAGFVQVNPFYIETFALGEDPEGHFNTGLNYMDELIAHEIGHILGIGTLWDDNGIYTNDVWTAEDPVGDYLGEHGLAAYRNEFDSTAAFVPVELAGSPGTANGHWDQLMRSSEQEGNPSDPWPLSPLTGITDTEGRDLGLELMTGAVDPDYGEPFLSRTTIASMADLGYRVTVPEDFNGDEIVDGADMDIWCSMFGTTGLQIDSFVHGDALRDRAVDGNDFLAWQRAVGTSLAGQAVPEPASIVLSIAGMFFILGAGVRESWHRYSVHCRCGAHCRYGAGFGLRCR